MQIASIKTQAVKRYERCQKDKELVKLVRPVVVKHPKPSNEEFKGLGKNIDVYA